MKIAFIFFGLVWTFAECNPIGYGFETPRREYQTLRYNPQQAMMFSGFYRAPSYQGSMSAFANKDIVATNSFAGDKQYPIQYPEATETSDNLAAEEELELTQTSTSKPKKSKKKPATTQKPDYDEEEEEDEVVNKESPGERGSGSQPGYNNFFPISFGARGNGRNSNGYPGGAVAIANSYSTGKGGIASSHATAYGDPYSSGNGRKRSNGNNGNGNKQYN